MKVKAYKAVALIAVALGLTLTGIQPAQAACITSMMDTASPHAPSIVASPQILTWTPYDYAQITTLAKCNARMAYVKSVNPDITHWSCQSFTAPQCPAPGRTDGHGGDELLSK